jgi:sec-independent protein translocase protein TatA
MMGQVGGPAATLIIGGLGGPELLIVFGVLMLFVGGSKLPDLARGSGRALRIFRAETRGMLSQEVASDVVTRGAPQSETAPEGPERKTHIDPEQPS